jgi:hypothetical protein
VANSFPHPVANIPPFEQTIIELESSICGMIFRNGFYIFSRLIFAQKFLLQNQSL